MVRLQQRLSARWRWSLLLHHISDLGGLVQATRAMWVVVAAARVAAGEVVVGTLVPILVPVLGLVQVAVLLLLLPAAAGAVLQLLLLLVAVGQLCCCCWRWGQRCYCWRRTRAHSLNWAARANLKCFHNFVLRNFESDGW
eukprot:Em0005g949a